MPPRVNPFGAIGEPPTSRSNQDESPPTARPVVRLPLPAPNVGRWPPSAWVYARMMAERNEQERLARQSQHPLQGGNAAYPEEGPTQDSEVTFTNPFAHSQRAESMVRQDSSISPKAIPTSRSSSPSFSSDDEDPLPAHHGSSRKFIPRHLRRSLTKTGAKPITESGEDTANDASAPGARETTSRLLDAESRRSGTYTGPLYDETPGVFRIIPGSQPEVNLVHPGYNQMSDALEFVDPRQFEDFAAVHVLPPNVDGYFVCGPQRPSTLLLHQPPPPSQEIITPPGINELPISPSIYWADVEQRYPANDPIMQPLPYEHLFNTFNRLVQIKGWRWRSDRTRDEFFLCAQAEYARLLMHNPNLLLPGTTYPPRTTEQYHYRIRKICEVVYNERRMQELSHLTDFSQIENCRRFLSRVNINVFDLMSALANGVKPKNYSTAEWARTHQIWNHSRFRHDYLQGLPYDNIVAILAKQRGPGPLRRHTELPAAMDASLSTATTLPAHPPGQPDNYHISKGSIQLRNLSGSSQSRSGAHGLKTATTTLAAPSATAGTKPASGISPAESTRAHSAATSTAPSALNPNAAPYFSPAHDPSHNPTRTAAPEPAHDTASTPTRGVASGPTGRPTQAPVSDQASTPARGSAHRSAQGSAQGLAQGSARGSGRGTGRGSGRPPAHMSLPGRPATPTRGPPHVPARDPAHTQMPGPTARPIARPAPAPALNAPLGPKNQPRPHAPLGLKKEGKKLQILRSGADPVLPPDITENNFPALPGKAETRTVAGEEAGEEEEEERLEYTIKQNGKKKGQSKGRDGGEKEVDGNGDDQAVYKGKGKGRALG